MPDNADLESRIRDALQQGDPDAARGLIDEGAASSGENGLPVAELLEALSRTYAESDRLDDAVDAMRRALDAGWSGEPDGRATLAEYLQRAGRPDEAEGLWAQLRAEVHTQQTSDAARGALDVQPDVLMALPWFPAEDWNDALSRWPALAQDWAGVSHQDYSRRIEQHLKSLSAHGARVRAVSPIRLADYLPWCDEHGRDPGAGTTFSEYAAELARTGGAIEWPPGRNDACWCGSGQKYKKCCGSAPAAQLSSR